MAKQVDERTVGVDVAKGGITELFQADGPDLACTSPEAQEDPGMGLHPAEESPYLQLERDQQQSKLSKKEIVDGGHERLYYLIQGACW
jgi:hypothetical protein